MALLLTDVRAAPRRAAQHATEHVPRVSVTYRCTRQSTVIFDAAFTPPREFAAHNYPIEQAVLLITEDGTPCALIPDDGRTWEHRNPGGDLCLWFEGDDRALRWTWEDGWEAWIAIVHRHLVYEEYHRRHGHWPVGAAPHGDGDHPIERLETHWKKQTWNR